MQLAKPGPVRNCGNTPVITDLREKIKIIAPPPVVQPMVKVYP